MEKKVVINEKLKKVESKDDFELNLDNRIYKCEECGNELFGRKNAVKHKRKICVKMKKEVEENLSNTKVKAENKIRLLQDLRVFECEICGATSVGRKRAFDHKFSHKLKKCYKCNKDIRAKNLTRH